LVPLLKDESDVRTFQIERIISLIRRNLDEVGVMQVGGFEAVNLLLMTALPLVGLVALFGMGIYFLSLFARLVRALERIADRER
jgi:hypothetical protein